MSLQPHDAATVNVLIVDDHPMILEYLSSVVANALPDAVVRIAADLPAALETAQESPLDLVLLDLGLPGCGGIESLLRFRKAFPQTKVLVVSADEDRVSMRGALAAGAAGFIPKTVSLSVLVGAIRLVGGGGRYVPPEALGEPEPIAGPVGRGAVGTHVQEKVLTQRQREVMRRLLKGRTIAEIAKELGIAYATAKLHALAVYAAFGVSSRADLLASVARRGSATG
jgi:DNA-binding NarL/FixJ family response regulator